MQFFHNQIIVPEANPIINSIKFQNKNTINSLYSLDKIVLNDELDHIEELSPQITQQTMLSVKNLEDVFLTYPVVYDKYEQIQHTTITPSLMQGSEFNEVLCNLQKLEQIKKYQAYTIEPEFHQEQTQSFYFDSEFESGNLSKVAKKNDNEYFLLLQNDLNSKGHTQWFYFRVRNHSKRGRVKFNILNLSKNGQLYQQGMKICFYQRKNVQQGWRRGGLDISYSKNGILKYSSDDLTQEWYTLSFVYDFTDIDDEVFFAQSYPYTVSDLNLFLSAIEDDQGKKRLFHRSLLCRTLAGNRVEKITISDPENPDHSKRGLILQFYSSIFTQGLVIMGRVHPGETVSSFIVQGFIEWLISDDQKAKDLRQQFVIQIIPILNPDGVIHGNYRTSLAGCDLNRRWKEPIKELHPEIYHAKNMVIQLDRTSKVALVIDCHGHNIKRSVFMYGCNVPKQKRGRENMQQFDLVKHNLECQQFPFILSQLDRNFSFKQCSYRVQKEKMSTARVCLWKALKIPQVYTLEASFCGPDYLPVHFRVQDLVKVGENIGQSIHVYYNRSAIYKYNEIQSLSFIKRQTSKEEMNVKIQNFQRRNKDKTRTVTLSLKQEQLAIEADDDEASQGSDSEPSLDNFSPIKQNEFLPQQLRSITVQRPHQSTERTSFLLDEPKAMAVEKYQIHRPMRQQYKPRRSLHQKKNSVPEVPQFPLKVCDISWFVKQDGVSEQGDRQKKMLNMMLQTRIKNDLDLQAAKNLQNTSSNFYDYLSSIGNHQQNPYRGVHKRMGVSQDELIMSVIETKQEKNDLIKFHSIGLGQTRDLANQLPKLQIVGKVLKSKRQSICDRSYQPET